MKKVLFVTYHFPPDARVGALRAQKMVKYLPEFHWSPEVLTVREKYYEAFDPSRLADVEKASIWRTHVVPDPLETMARSAPIRWSWLQEDDRRRQRCRAGPPGRQRPPR